MRLIIEQGGDRKTLETDQEEVYVGRAEENEVVLSDEHTSDRHCRIYRVDSGYYLSDLQTRIGTRLNGKQVREAALHPGDRIEIGDATIVFEPTPRANPKGSGFFLEAVEGNLTGKTFEIGQEPLTFGRHKKNRVVITDPGVSNYHAIITLDAEGPTVTDLRSTNGSRVNGRKVERQTLVAGDRLGLMGAVFVLRDRSGKSPPAPPASPARPEAKPQEERPAPPAPKPEAAAKEETAEAPPQRGAADEGVIEFDYDLLLEETSRSTIAQTVGTVIILFLILAFGGIVLQGIITRQPADPNPSQNYIQNWSFELDGGWDLVGPAAGGFDPSVSRGGERSLRLDLGAEGEEAVCRLAQRPRVYGDRPVQAKVQVKVDGPALVGLRLRWLSDLEESALKESLAPLEVGPTDWVELRGNFLPPDGTAQVEVECFAAGAGPATAWFDRVQMIQREETASPPVVASEGHGLRLVLDGKGVGDLSRSGTAFVDGLELHLEGPNPYGRSGAATAKGSIEGDRFSLQGKIYHASADHWDDLTMETEETPKGIGIRYDLPLENPPAGLALRFSVRMKSVGGSGPRLGTEDSDLAAYPWEIESGRCTELVLGPDGHLVSLTFSSPLRVSSTVSGDRAWFTLEGDPALLAKAGRTELSIQASSASPLQEGRALRALDKARALVEQGPWSEAVEELTRLEEGSATLPPEVARQAQELRKRIDGETKRGIREIDTLIEDYRSLEAPGMLQSAIRKIDRLQGLWQGGAVTEDLERKKQEALAILEEVTSERDDAEANRLYNRGRAHMDAGKFHLARIIYEHLKEAYPEADVIRKVDIDLEQIRQSRGE